MVSGGLSTAEKLASKNPAARAEGQRELAKQTTSQQQRTVTKARDIATKFEGTTSFRQVYEETKAVSPGTARPAEITGTAAQREEAARLEAARKAEQAQQEMVRRETARKYIQDTSQLPKAEDLRGTYRAAPKPKGFLEEQQSLLSRKREEQRLKSLRGEPTDPFKSVTYGVVGSFLGTGLFLKELKARPVETTKAVGKGLGDVGRRLITGAGFPEVGRVLKEEPGYGIGFGVGELTQAKGIGTTGRLLRRTTAEVTTRLSPKYRPVVTEPTGIRVIKDVPSKIPSRKAIDIEVSRPVSKILEPLPEQVKVAGEVRDLVSAQRSLFGRIKGRREIKVDKPLPTPDAPPLEKAFFASPDPSLRISRLGIVDQKEAGLLDVLSGEVTFRRTRPQALLFEQERVAVFPKQLKSVETKLRTGKALTATEEARLVRFQLRPTGEFKPIGFLTKEPEVVLAPGEIIKRRETLAVTLIEGRKVPIYRAEVKGKPVSEQELLRLQRLPIRRDVSRPPPSPAYISPLRVSFPLLPSGRPSMPPSRRPSVTPSLPPSVPPSLAPSVAPSVTPPIRRRGKPSGRPSVPPSRRPSVTPSLPPSIPPSLAPSVTPSPPPPRPPPSLPFLEPEKRRPRKVPQPQPVLFRPARKGYAPTLIGAFLPRVPVSKAVPARMFTGILPRPLLKPDKKKKKKRKKR